MTLHRDVLVHLCEHLVCILGPLHRSQDISGADAVDPHVGGKLESHALCEQDDPGLGGVVVRVPAVPLRPVGRGGHKDDPALLRLHPSGRFTRTEEHAVQVDVDDLLPLFIGDVNEIFPDAYAGIGYKDIDAAKLAVHLIKN